MMPEIADLLPHASPMILLDEVLSWEEGKITTTVTISKNSKFFIAGSGVPAHVGLEYMAQTCGAYAGLSGLKNGLPVRMGFLLGTRNFSANIEWFREGDRLLISAQEVLRQEQMGVFDCNITLNGEEVAYAKLTVYQP